MLFFGPPALATVPDTSIFEITAQFPDLGPVTATYLGEGCDSVALLVNDVWVFRFPKTAEVEGQLVMESRLLPAIAPHLPLPIPAFRYHGRPGENFQRRFVGYPKLPGVPCLGLDAADLDPAEVERLGRFLAALHDVPLEVASAAGVPADDLARSLHELQGDAFDSLADVAVVAPGAPVEAWRRYFERIPTVAATGTSVLTHNDFAAEHILVDPDSKRLTGVIDWSDAAITRPEVDFAGLFHWGGDRLVNAVLGSYTLVRGALSEGALDIARYMGACRGAMDVTFGIEMQRPEYVAAGLRALRELTAGCCPLSADRPA